MTVSLNQICQWIDHTALSQAIKATNWVVPTVQTVHILAIAVVASSALMIDLRLIGVFWANRPINAVSARFLPLIWWPLLILLATGAIMITDGEVHDAPPANQFNMKAPLQVLIAGQRVHHFSDRQTYGEAGPALQLDDGRARGLGLFERLALDG